MPSFNQAWPHSLGAKRAPPALCLQLSAKIPVASVTASKSIEAFFCLNHENTFQEAASRVCRAHYPRPASLAESQLHIKATFVSEPTSTNLMCSEI